EQHAPGGRLSGPASYRSVEIVARECQSKQGGQRDRRQQLGIRQRGGDRKSQCQPDRGERVRHYRPNNSRCARRRNTTPISALNRMKKLCCTNPKAAIWPSFCGNKTTQSVMAAARIGVGTVAAKKMIGRYPSRGRSEAGTPNRFNAMV